MKNSDFRCSYVVMQLCRGKELQHFPVFPFPSLLYLPTFHRLSTFPFPAFSFPTYSTFLLPSASTSLPFPVPFVASYIPLSLSTFPFSSQPYPSLLFLFPTFPLPYLSLSLPISFPTYLHPYLSTSFSFSSFPLLLFSLFFPLSLPFPSSWVFDVFYTPGFQCYCLAICSFHRIKTRNKIVFLDQTYKIGF